MTDARALAKAAGAASRLAPQVSALARLAADCGLGIARQANAVLEELDLLRHYLREALLAGAIDAHGPLAPLDVPPDIAAAIGAEPVLGASAGVYVIVVDGGRVFTGEVEPIDRRDPAGSAQGGVAFKATKRARRKA
jgi:hypothetical protein